LKRGVDLFFVGGIDAVDVSQQTREAVMHALRVCTAEQSGSLLRHTNTHTSSQIFGVYNMMTLLPVVYHSFDKVPAGSHGNARRGSPREEILHLVSASVQQGILAALSNAFKYRVDGSHTCDSFHIVHSTLHEAIEKQ
jgi:hypothetical protein